MPRALRIVLLMLPALLVMRSVYASTNPVITIAATELPMTGDTVTISFTDSTGKIYQETVPYGPSSTPADIASAFGAGFTRDYVCVAVGDCISGLGAMGTAGANNTGTLTFQLNGSSTFGAFSLPTTGPFGFSGTNAPTVSSNISLSSSASTANFGDSITLTATVSTTSATGMITFFDGGSSLGTVAIASGQATLPESDFTAGMHTITAQYSGDATNGGANSEAVIQTVSPVVSSVSFSQGPAQMGFVIIGLGFGSSQPQGSTVKLGTTVLTLLNWGDACENANPSLDIPPSATCITVQVPVDTPNAAPTPVVVAVIGAASTGKVTFEVISAFTCPLTSP